MIFAAKDSLNIVGNEMALFLYKDSTKIAKAPFTQGCNLHATFVRP